MVVCLKAIVINAKGGFQKMKHTQFICGNIVFSEFSKFLSHMSHIFLGKLIKVTFSAIFNMNSVIIL